MKVHLHQQFKASSKMKFTQIRKIDNLNELDSYLNPKTTPIGLVKTMFKKTKNLSLIKLDTAESYGAMLYDSDRDKYMVFTDAKYSDSVPSDNKAVHNIFKSLAKDFQNANSSLMQNNRMKEFKGLISENEMVGYYGVSVDTPDLIISTKVDSNFMIIDDIGVGLAGTLFDDDLIHKEKETLSLRDFKDIISTIKSDNLERNAEVQEIDAQCKLSPENQKIVDFMDNHKEQDFKIVLLNESGKGLKISIDEFIEEVNGNTKESAGRFAIIDKDNMVIDIDTLVQTEQNHEQWQDIPLAIR
jgi:hypothetical protein